jgi:hypothetical protein
MIGLIEQCSLVVNAQPRKNTSLPNRLLSELKCWTCDGGLTPIAVKSHATLDKSILKSPYIIQFSTLNWFPNVFTNKYISTRFGQKARRALCLWNAVDHKSARLQSRAFTPLDCVTHVVRETAACIKKCSRQMHNMRQAGEGAGSAAAMAGRSHRSSFRPRPPMSKVKVSGYEPARVRWPIWLFWTEITLRQC